MGNSNVDSEIDLPLEFAKRIRAQEQELDEAMSAALLAHAGRSPIEAATIQAARVTALSMKLAALSTQEATAMQTEMSAVLIDGLEESSVRVAQQMRSLEQSSDKTGTLLAKWTKWLAFGTLFLGVATAALVGVEIWAQLRERPKVEPTVAAPAPPTIGPAK